MKLAQLFEALGAGSSKIQKDCKKFLDAGGGRVMLHGSSKHVAEFQTVKFVPRKEPRDTPGYVHKGINEMMTEKFGWPFRNGLFVSGSMSTAAEYAESGVFAVFPIGDFEWLCNTKIKDMTGDYEEEYLSSRTRDIDAYVDKLGNSDAWLHNTDLKKALESKAEIMIKCDRFYLIDTDSGMYEEIEKELNLNWK